MAYIGSSAALVPVSFSTPDSQAFNGNDSSTVFTLSRPIVTTTQLEIIVNNVQQSPYDGSYSVSGTTLTFSEAPSTGTANVYVNYRDQAIGTITDETSVAKTGDTMSGTLIINGELFVNSNEINLDDLQSLTWGDGSVQVRGDGTAETLELRTSAATRVFVDSSGNVGIGTSSPTNKLHVVGTAKIEGSTLDLNDAGTFTISQNTTASALILRAAALSYLRFDTNGANERMRIDNAGNVGIGTTAPQNLVQIEGSSGTVPSQLRLGVTASDQYYDIGRDYTDGYCWFYGAQTGVYSGFKWATGGSERMRIASNGDLLVGTTTAFNNGKQCIAFNSAAHVGIALNQTNANNSGTFLNFTQNGTTIGYISGNATTTTYATSSDYRLKEDWVAVADALTRVNALKPVNFAWKADGSRVDGFLAHELAEVVPEAVTGTKDAMRDEGYEVTPAVLDADGAVVTPAVMGTRSVPAYQGIDQSKLVPLLTAALQEALAEITSLKSRLDAAGL